MNSTKSENFVEKISGDEKFGRFQEYILFFEYFQKFIHFHNG